MATLTGILKRWKGKDISADVLSKMKDGDKFVPYEIKAKGAASSTASTVASALRGIVLIRKSEIAALGDPDGEGCSFTLT